MPNILSYARVSRIHTLAMSSLSILCAYGYCRQQYYAADDTWNHMAFMCVSLAILLFHLATNTISEYRDCLMGVDAIHSPATKYRLVTGIVSRKHVLCIGVAAFVSASILGVAAVMMGRKVLLLPGLIGACISISYSEKPLMLKYKPCGEVCVFLAYGPLLFASCILSLVGHISAADVIFSVPFGLMTAVILLANNIRDYKYDLGKASTLVTKLGVRYSWILLLAMLHIAYAVIIVLACCEVLPMTSFLVLITHPLTIIAFRKRRDTGMVNILGILHIGFYLIIILCLFGLSRGNVVQNQIDLRNRVNIEASSWAEVRKIVDERTAEKINEK